MANDVRHVFSDNERRFSRFLPGSELSRLNRADGPTRVSDALFAALLRARHYRALTGGLFDPTVGAALAANGYDRSFEPGCLDRDGVPSEVKPARFDEVELDESRQSVLRPPHVQIDLGGMIKGHTVDVTAELLPEEGAVDAGGDARLRGVGAWEVEVEDPSDSTRSLLVLAVENQAIATSAANRRRWRRQGENRHHLMDPRSRSSAQSDLAQATVLAPSAELADVLAKTAFLLGSRRAQTFLSHLPQVAAVLVQHDLRTTCVGRLEVVG